MFISKDSYPILSLFASWPDLLTIWYNGVGIQAGGGNTVNRADLQRLAKERITDAKVLLGARRWSAAHYLAGYAVECALKACIAKLMKPEEFPDRSFAEKCWTHNLPQLLGLAGLKTDLDTAMQGQPRLAGKLGFRQGME
jgi:hypothetical protein